MSELRYDTVKIPKSAKWTPQGFLSIEDARVARVGVQNYWKDGKLVRELRRPENVKASVDSFRNSLVTLDHPKELVTADNASQHQKGFVPDCYYGDDGWIHAKLHITDKTAINAAIATHKQLSCGYTCNLKQKSGIWKDELGVMGVVGKEYEYDVEQEDIGGNHIALVERARAGDNARFDSDDENDVIIKIDSVSKSKKSMTVTTIKNYTIPRTGEKYEVKTDESPEIISVLDSLQSSLTKEYELGERVKSELDSLESEKSVLVAKLAQVEKDLEDAQKTKTDSENLAPLIASYVKTYELAKDALKEDGVDLFALDESGIKKAYLKKFEKYSNEKFDEFSVQKLDEFWDYHHKYFSPKNHTEETKKHLDGLTSESKEDSVMSDVKKRSNNLMKFN
jgi:hypothetical protein